jgi:prepilin-type N-terminal cleavage/methylation domain-containing protein/prepilin-type processing-associated H-X9-DG protein
MSCRSSRGFTLVELLMVVLIIGMLMALLMTALNSSREAARRSVCMSRMREVGTAVNSYEQAENGYPGWENWVKGQINATSGVSYVDYKEGWINELLPYLGRNDMYAAGTPGTTQTPGLDSSGDVLLIRESMNGVLVCPSDHDKLRLGTPDNPTSMVCNAGRQDEPATADAAADWRTNAVFVDRAHDNGSGGPDYSKRVEVTDATFIRRGDGLATTILLSESLEALSWHWQDAPEYETFSGIVFFAPDPTTGQPPKDVHRINGPQVNVTSRYDTARPSSNHPGGVNMIFADGHGRFVRQNIDYAVYCALMTPRGGDALEPGTIMPSNSAIRNQPPLTADTY